MAGIGDGLPELRIDSVSAESMKAWAVFLRDPNPIHLDPAAVRAKGLGDRVINQGPANVGYVITMLLRAFPGSALESLDSRFNDSIFAGDAVTAGGRVTALDGGRVCCEVWLKAEGRAEAITGTAVLRLP